MDENNEKTDNKEGKKKIRHPKLSELRGTTMTLSGDDDSLVAEATQHLVEFALTKGHTIHSVTNMSRPQLADFLRDFYGKAKVKNNDSLTWKDIRTGLHKFFLEEANVDILDRNFELTNAAFDLAVRANRKSHRMPIETDDLKKIYLSEAMDTNRPDSLQNKVFFDINLYICNKGKEYFRNMKKTDFDVSTDIHGRRYVWLKDISGITREDEWMKKMKKKNGDDDSNTSQVGDRMCERPGDPRCPLSSFLKYVTHLHPMTDAFWQRPKRNVSQSDYVWYDHAPLGSSTLTKIMQRISLQAGLSDNYTNYSIQSACIPLLESVCEEAMQAEFGGALPTNIAPSVDIIKPAGSMMSHSASEEMSSDDCMSQTSEMHANHSDHEARAPVTIRQKSLGLSRSVGSGSGSMDGEDGDLLGLMQAKTQVLDLIRGLMVKDIQKFVNWLKTVRVQYSDGELIVLCSPVDKSNVEVIHDDIILDKNGFSSPTNNHDHMFKKSGSLDLSEKRRHFKKNLSAKEETYREKMELPDKAETVIKKVEFNSLAGIHCSSEEFGPLKISIPGHDTLLMTGVPDNLQVMLLKKRGLANQQEPLPERVYCSESEMNVTELVSSLNSTNHRPKQQTPTSSNTNASSCLKNYHSTSDSQHKHQLIVQQPYPSPVMVTIPAAHSASAMSSFHARELYKDNRNKSLGYLDQPPPVHQGIALKRVSSTGTPVLKRQENVDTTMYPENLTFKRVSQELQATNLSMKHLKPVESPEAKRARAERLTDSLRVHQEILQNSPLIKRPGERNFSGFRHCYANTAVSSVKSEPLDTSYS